jgi:hypothetical protein
MKIELVDLGEVLVETKGTNGLHQPDNGLTPGFA